jgi:hypothetical protein
VVSEITNRGHGTKQVLDRFTTWIVLTTVCPGRQSDVYRPEPKLSPVSMVIYTSAYHVTILLKNLKNEGLEEPQDVVLKEWRESVSERVSHTLEERNVRATRENINFFLVVIHT